MLSTKSLSFFHSSQLGPIMRARRKLFHFNKWNNAIQMRVMHTSAEMMHRSLNSRAAPHRGCVYVSGTLEESANTCEVQTKEREESVICNRWPELSSDVSHDRFHRTRPETYAHAHSHMPAWLGLIFRRRPSVKQFVRKFNSSQMVWLRPGWWETIVPCTTLLTVYERLSLFF